jgi:hypothetical protein
MTRPAELHKVLRAIVAEDHPDWKRIRFLCKAVVKLEHPHANVTELSQHANVTEASYREQRPKLRKIFGYR